MVYNGWIVVKGNCSSNCYTCTDSFDVPESRFYTCIAPDTPTLYLNYCIRHRCTEYESSYLIDLSELRIFACVPCYSRAGFTDNRK